MAKMKTKWEGPIMTVVERLTRPKKRQGITETPVQTKGWGNIGDIIKKRKQKQEEVFRGTQGLRNTYRKAREG